MDFQTIRTRCATRFRDPAFAIVTDANWKDYVNDAYADVQAATPFWPWEATSSTSLTVSANTRTVALPVNVFHLTAVLNDTDDVRMRPFDGASEHYRLYPDDADSGPPIQYRVLGTTLYVYPKPAVATALRVEYNVAAAELSANGDLPAFPAEFHRVLVEGAMARAYTDDAALQQAAAHDAQFEAILTSLKVYMGQPQTERYPEIPDTFWT